MGYDTAYSVEIENVPEKSMTQLYDRIEGFLEDIWEQNSTTLSGSYYGRGYDWERDLIQVSSEFPEVFITVDGDGEESDDIWRAFIKDGAIQFAAARIVYDEYDPAKMQQVLPPRLKKQTDVEDLI